MGLKTFDPDKPYGVITSDGVFLGRYEQANCIFGADGALIQDNSSPDETLPEPESEPAPAPERRKSSSSS